MTDTKRRMARPRLIALWLISLALLAGACPVALAQDTDTVYDEAGVLTESQEQNVQEAFDSAQEESGQPIYAFLVPDTGVSTPQDRQDLLTQEAREANVQQDAGVIMVAPKDRWDVAANLNGVSEDAVSNAMEPDFAEGNFASGLIAGADEIKGEPVAPPSNPEGGVLLGGLLVLLAGAAALILFRNRRARRRRIEQERGRAEEEFAGLTTRLDEFDEKEQLVSGYLEAQRLLLDQETEEWVETRISDANTAGFAQEFNKAASVLTLYGPSEEVAPAPHQLPRPERFGDLNEAERTMDAYRAADEALDTRLLAAGEEIQATERAGQTARSEGVAVEPPKLRPEYDRLAREIGDRASHRDEFDPRQTLAALEELGRHAREYAETVRDNISARDALPDERHATEGTLVRARTALEDYRGAYERAVGEFGQAALGEVPNPGELSSGLLESDGAVERADRASSAGRFVEASSLLGRAADLAGETMRAPGRLKAATVEADRKKREGEEKLQELEARLAQAKANEHLMGPYQRQRLRDYESQLQNARYGFFGETGSPPSCSSRRWITITCTWATLHPSRIPGATGVTGTPAVAIGAAVIGVAETSAEGLLTGYTFW
jgi:hypothetical protein